MSLTTSSATADTLYYMLTHTHNFTPHDPLLCWLCSCLPSRSGTPDDWRPRYGLLLLHFLLSSAMPSSPISSPPPHLHTHNSLYPSHTLSPPGAGGSCLSRHWSKVSFVSAIGFLFWNRSIGSLILFNILFTMNKLTMKYCFKYHSWFDFWS